MKQAYRYLAFAVAVGVALQAAWIALGTFMLTKRIDDGKFIKKDYDNIGFALHGIFAILVLLVALILFGISFRAGLPEGVKWAGFVLLAVVLQFVFAAISSGVPAVGVLHGINALVVMALAGITGSRAGRAMGAPARPNPVAM